MRLDIRLSALLGPLVMSFFSAMAEVGTAVCLAQMLTLLIAAPTSDLKVIDAPSRLILSYFPDRPAAISVAAGLTIVVAMLKIIFYRLAGLRVSRLVHDVAHRLRTLLFRRSLGTAPGVLEAVGQSDLSRLLLVFPSEVALELRPFHSVCYQFILLAMYSIFLVTVSLKLALAALICFFFYQRAVKRFISAIQRTGESAQVAAAELGNFVQRLNNCYSLSRTYDSEQQDARHFTEASRRQANLSSEYDNACAMIFPLFEFSSLFACTILAVVAASSVNISIAHFSIFVIVIRRSAASLSQVGEFHVRVAALRNSYIKFTRILESIEEFRLESGNREFGGLTSGIEVRNLTFAFRPEREILRDISVQIPKGQTFALIGVSGCGKTTFARLLARHRDCDKGSILFDGIDIRDFTLASLYRRIAYVSQDSGEVFRGTVRENVLYGLVGEVSEAELVEACDRVGFSEFIRRCPHGFETMLDDRATTISGGERQRLALVRALLRKPSLILLDEFTNGLDPASAEKVETSLLAALPETTKIVITHDRSRLSLADRIGVIESGRLVQAGTMEELLSAGDGPFKRFWELESRHAAGA